MVFQLQVGDEKHGNVTQEKERNLQCLCFPNNNHYESEQNRNLKVFVSL